MHLCESSAGARERVRGVLAGVGGRDAESTQVGQRLRQGRHPGSADKRRRHGQSDTSGRGQPRQGRSRGHGRQGSRRPRRSLLRADAHWRRQPRHANCARGDLRTCCLCHQVSSLPFDSIDDHTRLDPLTN